MTCKLRLIEGVTMTVRATADETAERLSEAKSQRTFLILTRDEGPYAAVNPDHVLHLEDEDGLSR